MLAQVAKIVATSPTIRSSGFALGISTTQIAK
jgi:hypothetical protein